jgi:tetratricopeptide (TPR) repeat protein
MTLVDTSDGVLMLGAYGWAYRNPVRKLFYNLTITSVAVLVALVVGGIETLGLIKNQLRLQGVFWNAISDLNENFGALGYGIVALFGVSWGVSYLVYRFKRYDLDIAEIKRSRRRRPQDLSCYDYTMRAMPHVWTLERDESTKALVLLEKALTIDSEYPLALVLAGWCHAQRAVYTWVDDIVGSQAIARSLAERAAGLSGDDPLVLAVLGAVHTFVRNHGTARVLLERAVSLDPNCAWAWSRLGWLENYSDRPDKVIENFERALRLSPMDPMNFNNYVGIGTAHELLEEYDEAGALYRRALGERPNAVWIYRALAAALSGAGRIEEAKQALVDVLRNYPDLTISKIRQAMDPSRTLRALNQGPFPATAPISARGQPFVRRNGPLEVVVFLAGNQTEVSQRRQQLFGLGGVAQHQIGLAEMLVRATVVGIQHQRLLIMANSRAQLT